MVKAFKAGRDTAEAVIPETRIAILSTGDPAVPTHTCGTSRSNTAARWRV